MPVQVSLTGLTPFTNYSTEAAPVNNQNQVGSYSDPVLTQTQEDSEIIALQCITHIYNTWHFVSFPAPGPVVITSSSPSFFKISITWDPPEIRTGIIIAYEVSYRPASAPQTITTMKTTDLDTSFTTESGLELGTAYIFTQFGNDPHSAVNHLKIDGDGCLSRVVSGPVESLLYRLLYGVTLCCVI